MKARLLIGALASGLCSVPAWAAPTLASGQDVALPWPRLIGALALCLGLAVAAVLALRKRQGLPLLPRSLLAAFKSGRDAAPPRLVEAGHLRLSNQVQVTLFTVDGEPWLAAVSPQGQVTLLRPSETGS